MTSIPDITLNNGQAIPQFGFGVFQIQPNDTVAAVSTALEAGYRHIDTAEMYGNEAEVGEAIARSALDRGEVFVTSKLSNDAHEPGEARQAFDRTLKALGTEYVDLFLIHWPLPARYGGDFVQTWQTLEEFYREGRARSIGVSNFQPHHLRRLHGETQIPAVNQIEVHPYLTQDDVRTFCAEHQIAVEAWLPLARGSRYGESTSSYSVSAPGRAVVTRPAQCRPRCPRCGPSRRALRSRVRACGPSRPVRPGARSARTRSARRSRRARGPRGPRPRC